MCINYFNNFCEHEFCFNIKIKIFLINKQFITKLYLHFTLR